MPMLVSLSTTSNAQLAGTLPHGLFGGTVQTVEMSGCAFSSFGGAFGGGRLSFVLTTIELSGNRLLGRVPSELCSSDTLVVLDLDHNRLHSAVPACFSGMRSLTVLRLSFNPGLGSVDARFVSPERASSLALLSLAGSGIEGRALFVPSADLQVGPPAASAAFPRLTELDLSHNPLALPVGTLVARSRRAFPSLTSLSARNASLSGFFTGGGVSGAGGDPVRALF